MDVIPCHVAFGISKTMEGFSCGIIAVFILGNNAVGPRGANQIFVSNYVNIAGDVGDAAISDF